MNRLERKYMGWSTVTACMPHPLIDKDSLQSIFTGEVLTLFIESSSLRGMLSDIGKRCRLEKCILCSYTIISLAHPLLDQRFSLYHPVAMPVIKDHMLYTS